MARGEGYLRKRGNVWYFEFTYRGKRYYERIGNVSKSVAKEIASKIRADIIRGVYIPPDSNQKPFSELVKAYRDYYLTHTQAKEHAIKEHLRKIDAIEKFFGNRTVGEITTALIEQFKKELKEKSKMSEVSINKYLAVLRSIFRKAKELDLYKGEIPKINFFKAKAKEIVRYLTPEEANRLLEVSPIHLRRIILFALLTGMRAGEIISLRWENIKKNEIVLESKSTKSKRQYTYPITEDLRKLLDEIRKEQKEKGIEHGFVFTNSFGKPYTRLGYRRAFKTALRKAGIENFRFHDLRHTFASWLALTTKDIYLVSRMLHHQSVQTTKRYAHLTQDYMKESLSKISALLRQKEELPQENIEN